MLKRKNLYLFISLLLFSCLSSAYAGSGPNLRGLEKEEKRGLDPARNTASAVLYVPKQLLNGMLYGTAETADYTTDPEFIRKVKDILYLYKRKLAWFPVLDYASGFRPSYGAGLYYKEKNFRSIFLGSLHDANHWELRARSSYIHNLDNFSWKTSLGGVLERKDDNRFYGIGADPKNDPRNRFLADADYGVFTAEKRRIEWKTRFSNTDNRWKFGYMGYYQRQDFEEQGRGNKDMRDIMDLTLVPGFQTNAPVTQIYDELFLILDTRNKKKIIAPGFHGEIFSGIANGLGNNESDFIRAGMDAAVFIPTIREDRVIIPRVVTNIIEEVDHQPIPFSEYTRHSSFRGISSREWVANDNASIVPSLEYQWPLSHFLSGHLFADYLATGKNLGKLEWDNGLWAAGFGVDFHYFDREFCRLQFAGGSQGFQVTVTIGNPLQKNAR